MVTSVSNEPDNVMRCPRCFGRDVRHSRRNGFFDGLMEKLHRAPFRCRSCSNRFYLFVSRKNEGKLATDQVEREEPGSAHNPNAPKPAGQ
jgi:hypothetical protein